MTDEEFDQRVAELKAALDSAFPGLAVVLFVPPQEASKRGHLTHNIEGGLMTVASVLADAAAWVVSCGVAGPIRAVP